jgi:hypothetical protein
VVPLGSAVALEATSGRMHFCGEAVMAEQRYKKLTINVSPELHEELQRLAEEQDITVTDLIKRSIALQKFIWEHRDGEILIKENDTIRQIVLI